MRKKIHVRIVFLKPKNKQLHKLPNLDVTRFLLASLVLIFHVPRLCKNQGLPYFDEWPVFSRGTEAVYMFFVLSGFLIIGIIYRAKQRGVFSIKNFYMRRALRILPLYYLIVIVGFVFYWLVLPMLNIPFENNYPLNEGLVMTTFFLPNVFVTLYKPGGILEILWSIGIEEQFYLMIAPLLFVIPIKRILIVLIALIAAYFLIFHTDLLPFLMKFKMVYFFLFAGGIMAILEEKRQLEFLKKSMLFPSVFVVLTILYFTTDLLHFSERWLFNLITMLLFSLFIHSIAHNNLGVKIKNRLLNHFGQISYGIYMYHVLALNLVVYFFLKIGTVINDWVTIILINSLTFATTLLIAHLSYTYFETYFLRLKSKFRK